MDEYKRGLGHVRKIFGEWGQIALTVFVKSSSMNEHMMTMAEWAKGRLNYMIILNPPPTTAVCAALPLPDTCKIKHEQAWPCSLAVGSLLCNVVSIIHVSLDLKCSGHSQKPACAARQFFLEQCHIGIPVSKSAKADSPEDADLSH
eukprot:1155018-Pelagomonas_calceolata.AAC.2